MKRSRQLGNNARRIFRGVIALGVLAIIGTVGAGWRVNSILNGLLRIWAVGVVADRSGGAYHLAVGHLHVLWGPQRFSIDTLELTTDHAKNAARPRPLPYLHIVLAHCTTSGLRFVRLLRGQGLEASQFGCRSVTAVAIVRRLPAPDSAAAPRGSPSPAGTTVVQQRLQLPSFAPSIRIRRIGFPNVGLELHLPGARRGEAMLALRRLQWKVTDLEIDPGDSAAAERALFSRSIEVTADDFVAHPDSTSKMSVDHLRMSLTDSTLELRGVAYGPTVSDAVFSRQRRYRRDRVRMTLASMSAAGLDYGALASGSGLRARWFDVDSASLDIVSDKRVPDNPHGRPRSTPQQWIADLRSAVQLDTVYVRDTRVVYREQQPGHPRPGAMSFARITATAYNVGHFPGRRTTHDAMRLAATTSIMGAGRLDVTFVMPLDAPRFDMTFRGSLGPMSVAPLNRFVEEVLPVRLTGGDIAGLTFGAVVTNGVASGTITPLYRGLSVSIRRTGSTGILGGGGIFGGAARGIASMVANGTRVRTNNPDGPGRAPRIGVIRHAYGGEGLPGFLWISVRDGLLPVVAK